jgi:ribulose-bisphosphate carboxylase large chain
LHKAQIVDFLSCKNYRWTEGARHIEPFKNVTRQELIGKSDEKTSFDLRYLEIQPGGYSDFEKHGHERVIIGVRGKGLCVKKNKKISVSTHDVAYIGRLEEHQMRNTGSKPFGFFCIVDHKRNKPVRTDYTGEAG